MRIVESQNLVPEGVDLLGAVLLHLIKRRALVDALAIFEELDGQRLCNIVFDYLSLTCEVGVEEFLGLRIVDDFVVEDHEVGDSLAGLAVEESPRLFEAGSRYLGDIVAYLYSRAYFAVLLNGAELVHSAEDGARR